MGTKKFTRRARKKTAHDYSHEIMRAVDLAMKDKHPFTAWNEKYGKNVCLYDAVARIVRRAMRRLHPRKGVGRG